MYIVTYQKKKSAILGNAFWVESSLDNLYYPEDDDLSYYGKCKLRAERIIHAIKYNFKESQKIIFTDAAVLALLYITGHMKVVVIDGVDRFFVDGKEAIVLDEDHFIKENHV